MKLGKKVAGLSAMALVATSAAFAVGTASPAQAAVGTTTAKIDYTCGLANGTASTITPYNDVDLKIEVTPTSAPEGTSQTIKLTLGGGANSAFNNGPFVPSTKETYRVVFNISVDGGAPINVVSTTESAVAGVNSPVFPNGVTATIGTGSITPALTAGAHTVKLQQIVVNSTASGDPWVTGAATNVTTNATSFDSICNGGSTQMTIVGNNAPTAGFGPPQPVPASYLDVASTEFTVTPCTGTTPTGTSTALTASPASPRTQGTSVTFNAKVTASSCNLGSKSLDGTLQFKRNGSNLGSAQTIGAAGTASITTASLPVGVSDITAVFTPTDDSGADGFTGSTSDALSYTIEAKSTPKPTSKPTKTKEQGPSTDAVSDSATVNVYCEPKSKATLPGTPSVTPYKWPVKITVSPGAAKPGEKVTVSLSVEGNPKNGPVSELVDGAYTFRPAIKFQGETITFTNGTVSSGAVGLSQPIFKSSQLPLKASGNITLPNKKGSFPITIANLNFKNTAGSSFDQGLDIFDNTCNASQQPNDAPKAFAQPTVKAVADPNADSSKVTGDGGSEGSGGVLAATGPKELAILAILALAVLQIGAIVTVRAQRSTPRRARH